LTGVPSLVTIDSNQKCKVVIGNCAPYEVTIERNNILGIIEMEEDKLYPLTEETTAGICAIIKSNIPDTPRPRLTKDEFRSRMNSRHNIWTSSTDTRRPSASTSTT